METKIINPSLVRLDADLGSTPDEVISGLAAVVTDAGRSTSVDELAAAAHAREAKSHTGVPGGVAIPHCRCAAVTEPTLGFARLKDPVDFGAPDGPADLTFLIAAPEGGGREHLKILSTLARALVNKEFVASLRAAGSDEEVVALITEVLNNPPKKKKKKPASTEATAAGAGAAAAAAAPAEKQEDAAAPVTRIVAITACPTGIAHTYMAADSLTNTVDEMDGVELTVETQGSSAVTPMDPEVIAAADAVIFATDVGVKDRERFAGKPVIESGVKRAINEPRVMIEEAIAASKDPNAHRVSGNAGAAKAEAADSGSSLSWPKRIQQAIMTGVSYMVPFVAAGGLLLALGFLFGGYDMANAWETIVKDYSITNLPGHDITVDGEVINLTKAGFSLYLGAVLFATGQMAMGFIVAALSGYTAFAIAGRPGIAPGFVGGAISVLLGAGFIGGLVTGVLAGFVAWWIGSWKVHRVIASLMPVVIIPLLTSLIVGLAMFFLLGAPLAGIMNGLTNWLNSMTGTSAVLLGIILGLMMCFDLGGPVNKAAYLFGTAGLSAGDEASLKIMAAVMAAGMVPPIALSIATFVRPRVFTPAEQENGKSSWLLGLSFVSEGAIPFAAADPLRVIPSMMVGGAVTGALSMLFGAGSRAPHGGVFVLFAIEPKIGWLISIIAGVIVSAAAVVLLKMVWPQKIVEKQAEAAKAEAHA
ncbi:MULTISPECIES: fructose-specific PTS transporter subunit EIIC [Corynebacterium]|uniref:PTS sugar transporter subunit IIA n=2 Tax=Corynebacterium glucuronolyticum TaxID=39791 RepID=A0AAX1L5Q2_9CORY|nr:MULTISPECIES: fructose-specific PTS transporter subunit EIIC [Corynebacterium]EEI26456.1 phosphoenolpyruvate-dependent sugar phosphotransferase system, EIIA 2 [Corynebacterium glucuronolyticum ATCC 51867]EEI62914.1 phosphoenolpyruvate-dependent sugar phosphotransferase system, EIIA 2 [Corynebacterium glucuronolyticum ATCC 51866]MCT1442570.1 fructose-specific PTS transporter subunit EIIC [Corynebacterium glucuronolyticum]OFO43184.1 PTS lactose transporter subunit IIC [Corynebacterium sp. HMSC